MVAITVRVRCKTQRRAHKKTRMDPIRLQFRVRVLSLLAGSTEQLEISPAWWQSVTEHFQTYLFIYLRRHCQTKTENLFGQRRASPDADIYISSIMCFVFDVHVYFELLLNVFTHVNVSGRSVLLFNKLIDWLMFLRSWRRDISVEIYLLTYFLRFMHGWFSDVFVIQVRDVKTSSK